MKIKNIANWNFTPPMENLLFFANLIDEMTFNYTLDSFKASVHNVFSLIRECIETIDDIEDETIKKGSLPPITEEIKDTIDKDPIINEVMLANGLDLVVSKIDGNTKPGELKLVLEMFLAVPIIQQYNDCVKRKLADLIKTASPQKENIEKLSRLFVAQMKYMGLPNASIHKKNKDFFFGRNSSIHSANDIDAFFSLFDLNDQKYTVCLFGNHLYSYLKFAGQPVDIDIRNNFNLSQWDPNLAWLNNVMPNKGQYIFIETQAYDEYHALLRSMKRIAHFTSLYSFFHHKNSFKFIREECVIRRNSDGAISIINSPMPVIMACKDVWPSVASTYYQQTISGVNLEINSLERFIRSVRLHDSAKKSEHMENQFLNLFTAFEVLIPKDVDSGKDRILQIIDILIPYLCQNHFQKLAVSFGQDLKLWNNALYTSILAQITDGNTDDEKLCALICLAKYQNQRDQIFRATTSANYYLLRYRLWKLNDRMGNIQSIRSTFLRFEKRMRWHVTRLYRTRNLIVHAGAHPKYLNMLLENIHSFYDTFMRELISDVSTQRMLKLEYSFLIRQQRYNKYLAYLDSLALTLTIDENNFLQVLGIK